MFTCVVDTPSGIPWDLFAHPLAFSLDEFFQVDQEKDTEPACKSSHQLPSVVRLRGQRPSRSMVGRRGLSAFHLPACQCLPVYLAVRHNAGKM